MIGLLLCGGRSQRMGDDKGLLKRGDKNWTEIGIEKFVSVQLPFLISINETQVPQYLLQFAEQNLSVDNSSIAIQGPLLGLMSAHLLYPDQDILVLACDMIDMETGLINELMSAYENSTAEAVAFKGETIEPLCAIYSSEGLRRIFSAYESNRLKKHSMMYVLEYLDAMYIPIKDEQKAFFKNFNKPGDVT